MSINKMIERINYLSQKKRLEGLTKEESNELKELQGKYIAIVNMQM